MSLTNPNTPVSQQDLKDFYDKIKPYMGLYPSSMGKKVGKGDIYSTEERLIGQWIDGKPLYQKVVHLTNVTLPATGQYTDIDIITDTNCKLKRAEGFIFDNSIDVLILPIYSMNRTQGTLYWAGEVVQQNATGKITLKLINYNGAILTWSDAYVIVQYTKTTDSAISIGDETDYSTTEKIVGTWIDGSPIWQVTYEVDLTNKVTTSLQDIIITNSIKNTDVDDIVSIDGALKMNGIWRQLTTYAGASAIARAFNADVASTGTRITIYESNSSAYSQYQKAYVTIQYTKTTT